MKKLFCLVFLAVIGGCSHTPAVDGYKPVDKQATYEQRLLMVGTWFGDAPTKDGGRKMHIVDRFLDGTMKIRFRLVDAQGNSDEQTELAQWGLSGDIYFTISRGILDGEEFHEFDLRQPYFNDAYEVLELTEATFHYRHLVTGSEYTIHRVEKGFDFPSSPNQRAL
nr:hypothetical protein [Oceanococcus sp. HetDA_MAG_MS8]